MPYGWFTQSSVWDNHCTCICHSYGLTRSYLFHYSDVMWAQSRLISQQHDYLFMCSCCLTTKEIRNLSLQSIMPPSHCRECCLRTNTNWHSLRIAQYRIDSNYFLLVRCHFRVSSQANTNVLKCSKHSYWPCESILSVLRRIASPNVVSIRVSSYWFVSHRCTFVSIRCTFALGFAACLLRLSTLQYDAQWSYCRIGSHMFALVRVSSY